MYGYGSTAVGRVHPGLRLGSPLSGELRTDDETILDDGAQVRQADYARGLNPQTTR